MPAIHTSLGLSTRFIFFIFSLPPPPFLQHQHPSIPVPHLATLVGLMAFKGSGLRRGYCHIHSYSTRPLTSSTIVPAYLPFVILLSPPHSHINLRSTSTSCLQHLLRCPLPSLHNNINISIHPTLLQTAEDLHQPCKGFSTILVAVTNTTLHVPTPQSLIRRFSHELADPACG